MAISEPRWLQYDFVLRIHDTQLKLHGGAQGIRDENVLRSAINRPLNAFYYESDQVDLYDLAAEYGFGIAGNHPFIDGNKRTAFVSMKSFLKEAGIPLNLSEAKIIEMMQKLGRGEMDKVHLAAFLRLNSPVI